MAYTISTHNGSAVSRQHNIRNPKVVAKQPHIRADGVHETWIDVDPRKAYREIFGDAQEEYNRRQLAAGRPGRCIKSYYTAVKNDAKKHLVYEMIVAIGNVKNQPPPFTAKDIMRDFVDDWPKRNPTLKLVGAYYHRDEQGVGHVHIDYIPVATGYKNGMAVQNGLVKALNAIGFETRSTRDTAQIQWERRENQYLEQLCLERGLEVEHPLEEERKHSHTEKFKADAGLKEAQKQLEAAKLELEQAQVKHDDMIEKVATMRQEGQKRFEANVAVLEEQKSRIEALKRVVEVYERQIEAQEHTIENQKQIYKIFGGRLPLYDAQDPAHVEQDLPLREDIDLD